MSLEIAVEAGSIGPKATPHEGVPIAQIARQLDLDRKTVRRCIRDTEWRAYQRPPRTDTLHIRSLSTSGC